MRVEASGDEPAVTVGPVAREARAGHLAVSPPSLTALADGLVARAPRPR